MKQKSLCLLTVMLLGGLLTHTALAESSFPDVDEYSEYAEAVDYVSNAGIMVGDDQGNFNPNKAVTRAEMATLICRLLGKTENLSKTTAFTDVPVSHWANIYVGEVASLDIVNGYGNGKFGPDDNVTYEQSVTMIMRAIGGSKLATNAGGYPDGFLSVAEQHGFLENVHAEKGEALSRGDIAILLMNCSGFHFSADSDSAQGA